MSGVTDINNVNVLAPEYKNMEMYMNRLIEICILNCYKEFALCIYRGDPIPIEIKKNILSELHKGVQVHSKEQCTKLDNYLNMYKMYLQRKLQDIINDGMCVRTFWFEINCLAFFLFKNLILRLWG